MRRLSVIERATTTAAFLLSMLAGKASAQTGIPAAFHKTTCSNYVDGQSWLMMSCGPSGFASVVGLDAATNTLKNMATVTDFTMMGKKPYESFTEAIFLVDAANSRVFLGSGEFNSHAAVLKVQNSCGQTGFVAATIIDASLTTNGIVESAAYMVPHSFHTDEVSAEKAAAAISAEDPGETGDYPPTMSPDVTTSPHPDPNIFLPGKYIPGPNAPEDHAQRAIECYNVYRATCRTAFTTYKNTLAVARANRLNAQGTGAAVGAGIGGGGAAVGVVIACLFGPPGWVVAGGVIAGGAAVGGGIGVVAGPAISYSNAKVAAVAVLKNDLASAYAGYIKCLEGAGYIRNPMY